jgi:tetratricopeptide (TPR) repeat protein
MATNSRHGPNFSVWPLKTELELAHEQYRAEFGETAGSELLRRAAEADDSYGLKKLESAEKAKRLAEAVVWARRESGVDNDEIERLRGVVGKVSEFSYEGGYSLSTILLGAATGGADLVTRANAAATAGDAATASDEWEAARAAYTDCLESLRVLNRFFVEDAAEISSMESRILRDWTQVRTKLGSSEHPFDLHAGDAANVLLERVVWNTDFGGGFLPQTDAMARLVIRLEHWFEVQNGNGVSLAASWRDAIFSTLPLPGQDDDISDRTRCAVTCADALLETGNYEAALQLYAGALDTAKDAGPLFAHPRINQAFALYGLGRKQEALEAFDGIDGESLKSSGGFILTLEAEWARYVAASCLLKPANPEADKAAAHEEVRRLVHRIGSLSVGSAAGRTGYLRNLFVGQLSRDTGAIMAMVSYG